MTSIYEYFRCQNAMRIIHIDDHHEISAIFSDILALKNHDFESTTDGKNGIELVLKNNYDLILLDLHMPRYTGFDFLAELKIKKPSEIKKVVVISSYQLDEAQTLFLMNLGIDSVHRKPVSVQRLLTHIVVKPVH
jgi:DNA-binding response OmpR family regulator